MRTDYHGIRSRYDNGVFGRSRLSNGIQVYLQEPQMVPDEEGLLMLFLPEVGSWLECPEEYGSLHFFEHVLSDLEKLHRLHERGGRYGASVGIMKSEFWVSAPKEDFKLALATLKSVFVDPPISGKTIEREIGVIGEEYRKIHSNSGRVQTMEMARRFFGEDHPFGHSPVGNKEVIDGMTPECLEDIFRRYYHAGNMCLVCGGAFAELDEPLVLDSLEKVFGSVERKEPVAFRAEIPSWQKGKRLVISHPLLQRDTLIVTYFDGQRLDDADVDALDFLAEALTDDRHAAYMMELRNRRGLAYEHGLCSSGEGKLGWRFDLAIPIIRSRFDDAYAIFLETLASLDEEYLLGRQAIRQLRRKSLFKHPMERCHALANAISGSGEQHSSHYWQTIEDDLTAKRVLDWRDTILSSQPAIIEVRSG
jgi:zinc protease